MIIIALIPAYNEAERIAQAVKDAQMYATQVVVTDDGSRDDTASRARQAGAHVLQHLVNRGQGAALQTATDYALDVLEADVVVHFDADGQMLASEIPQLVAPIVSGEADVVLGSRFLGKSIAMPISRLVMLKLGLLFTLLASGIKTTDTHNGFRVLSRQAARDLRITLDRMAHASELLDLIALKKLRYLERPVTITYTPETLTKGHGSWWGSFKVVKDFLTKKFLG